MLFHGILIDMRHVLFPPLVRCLATKTNESQNTRLVVLEQKALPYRNNKS